LEKKVKQELQDCIERLSDCTEDLYDEIYDYIDDNLVEKYGWEELQKAIFDLLSIDGYTENQYECLAAIIYSAILRGETVDAMPAICLTNYRLNSKGNPYDNNTAWSITCDLLHLDYANSEYNIFDDARMREVLGKFGIKI